MIDCFFCFLSAPQFPQPESFRQIDVNDLFSKLLMKGIIKAPQADLAAAGIHTTS